MGAGKTTIGRHLSKSLGMEFVDSDREIEERTGASIPLIFDVEGEAGFRKRETAMIDELTQCSDIVLATGGGAILHEDNRRYLAGRGHVLYLRCTVDQQLERTSRDRNRPLLQTEDPRARLEALLQERGPLYEQTADWIIDTDGQSVKRVVKRILKMIEDATDNGLQQQHEDS